MRSWPRRRAPPTWRARSPSTSRTSSVLDDGIGATAAQMVREISPATKVVLVWPGAVVPIGGDARVEPSEVLRSLGPAVTKVSGHPGSTMETIQRPDWIDKVRKDPSTLREMLERRAASMPKRPSVTELQKRGQRLHPVTSGDDAAKTPDKSAPEKDAPGVAASGDADVKEKAAEDKPAKAGAPLVILPGTPTTEGDAGEPIVVLPSDEPAKAAEPVEPAASADAGSPGDSEAGDEDTKRRRRAAVIPIAAGAAAAATRAAPAAAAVADWNQKLGTIALGGAAVAGALVLALALGGSRVHTQIAAEAPTRPPSVAPSVPGPGGNNGPDNGGNNGPENGGNNGPDKGGNNGPDKGGEKGGSETGSGTNTGAGPSTGGGGGGGDNNGGGGGGGDNNGGGGGGGDNGGGGGGDNGGGGGGDNGGGGGGGGDNNGGGGGGDNGGGDGGGGGGNGGGGGGGGGGGETPRTYGASAEHNPHGGPPGHADCDPSIEAPGNNDNAPGQTGEAPPEHSHAGGNGNGKAYGLEKKTHAHKC